MNSQGENYELANALSWPVYSSFADGVAFVTEDGGLLRFDTRNGGDSEEPGVRAEHLTAVALLPERSPDDVNVFSLVSALVDAEGDLWERRRVVSIYEIWDALLNVGELQLFHDPPRPVLGWENALRIKRRVLLEPIETVCDGRDRHFVEVASERVNEPQAARRTIERWLFRLHFKYFGASIRLVEDRASFATPTGGETEVVNRMLTMTPFTDAPAIACLAQSDALIESGDKGLMEFGPLCARGVTLKSAWETSSGEPARRGDKERWRRAFEPYMEGATLERVLRPNLKVRYGGRWSYS